MTTFTTYSVMRRVPGKAIQEWADFVESFFSREEAERLADKLNQEYNTLDYFVEVD